MRCLSSSTGAAQAQGSKDNASTQSPTPNNSTGQANGSSNGIGTGSGMEDRAKLLRAVVPCQQSLSLLFDARHIGGWTYSTSHFINSHHTTSHHITSHHTTSHHITSHHITSHHIISYHITSHHTTLLQYFYLLLIGSLYYTSLNLIILNYHNRTSSDSCLTFIIWQAQLLIHIPFSCYVFIIS